MQKKIIHVDMDAFYAAVEIRDNPSLRGKPVIVGGLPQKRGVVSTCSYEARAYGVHSAMASALAVKLCPQAVFLTPRFDAYLEASKIIRSIFYEYTELIEPLSLDEAYLDVTENKLQKPSATLLALEIKKKIYQKTRLTASAGVSYNKFLAKIGSEMNKPNGLCVITPQEAERVLERLPIEKFYGIGRVTAAKMKNLGITTGADLKKWDKIKMAKKFGKMGEFYYEIVRGIDLRPVVNDYIRKSISKETTFAKDTSEQKFLLAELTGLIKRVAFKLQRDNIKALCVNVKIKYSNFEQITRSCSFKRPLQAEDELLNYGIKLFLDNLEDKRLVRLVGFGVSDLLEPQHYFFEQIFFPFYECFPIYRCFRDE